DALHDAPLRLVVARHEAGAANMAEAYGKLTGRPGICFVTRAPGATHAAVGVYTAFQDSTPLILFVGQVPLGHRGREAFQELDYERMFGGIAKWVTEGQKADDVPDGGARAFRTAMSGRPGPVVVALPEDVLSQETDAGDVVATWHIQEPDSEEVLGVRSMLERAERPLVVVGGGGWSDAAASALQHWAEASQLPVMASFRRQDYLDNSSPSYVGALTLGQLPSFAQRVRDADLLIALGTRLGEIATRGYTTLEPPDTPQPLVHVHRDPAELGRVFHADVPIVADPGEFVAAMEPV